MFGYLCSLILKENCMKTLSVALLFRSSLFFCGLVSLVSCGCSPNGESLPVMGKSVVYEVDVEELSGLCLNVDKTALLACGDQGVIKTISFNGEVSGLFEYDADMEGITIDPSTGDIWIAVEGRQAVCGLSAPEYKEWSTSFYVKEAVDSSYKNAGLEGIEYYKEDIIFVGSQKDVNLWQYRMDGTMVSKISLSDFASEIAGLCYDPVGDWLWISDSNREELYLATVDGKLLATYSLEGIKNAESVCVDRERGCIWIGSDEDDPKLYRFEMKF